MPEYLVTGENDAALAKAVQETYPNDHIKAWDGCWIVSDNNLIAKQVSEKIGVTGGSIGKAMVVAIAGYSGWAPKTVWEWLRVRGSRDASS
jgi:hypothetical protein